MSNTRSSFDSANDEWDITHVGVDGKVDIKIVADEFTDGQQRVLFHGEFDAPTADISAATPVDLGGEFPWAAIQPYLSGGIGGTSSPVGPPVGEDTIVFQKRLFASANGMMEGKTNGRQNERARPFPKTARHMDMLLRFKGASNAVWERAPMPKRLGQPEFVGVQAVGGNTAAGSPIGLQKNTDGSLGPAADVRGAIIWHHGNEFLSIDGLNPNLIRQEGAANTQNLVAAANPTALRYVAAYGAFEEAFEGFNSKYGVEAGDEILIETSAFGHDGLAFSATVDVTRTGTTFNATNEPFQHRKVQLVQHGHLLAVNNRRDRLGRVDRVVNVHATGNPLQTIEEPVPDTPWTDSQDFTFDPLEQGELKSGFYYLVSEIQTTRTILADAVCAWVPVF